MPKKLQLGVKLIEKRSNKMSEERFNIAQLIENSTDNSAEVQNPDPESLFDLLEKKVLLKVNVL
jgi:hypothetical protein